MTTPAQPLHTAPSVGHGTVSLSESAAEVSKSSVPPELLEKAHRIIAEAAAVRQQVHLLLESASRDITNGKFSDAMVWLNLVIESYSTKEYGFLHAEVALAHRYRAEAEYQLGETKNAFADIDTSIEKNYQDPSAYLLRAKMLREHGNVQGAHRDLRYAAAQVDMLRQEGIIDNERGLTYLAERNLKKADFYFLSAFKNDAQQTSALFHVALLRLIPRAVEASFSLSTVGRNSDLSVGGKYGELALRWSWLHSADVDSTSQLHIGPTVALGFGEVNRYHLMHIVAGADAELQEKSFIFGLALAAGSDAILGQGQTAQIIEVREGVRSYSEIYDGFFLRFDFRAGLCLNADFSVELVARMKAKLANPEDSSLEGGMAFVWNVW